MGARLYRRPLLVCLRCTLDARDAGGGSTSSEGGSDTLGYRTSDSSDLNLGRTWAAAWASEDVMADTFDILRALVSRVKCKPGWRFRIVEEEGALRMVIRINCKDAYD